ncbi:MAG: PAS domain S-box protein [Campylobacterales bacterium]
MIATPYPIKLLYAREAGPAGSVIATFLQKRVRSYTQCHTLDDMRRSIALTKPDLIITNLDLEGGDPLEILKEAKTHQPDLTIIIISSHSDVQKILIAIEIGIRHYLIKPITLPKLEEILDEAATQITQRHEFLRQKKLLEEYKFALDAGTIVSKTDRQGIITYANDQFCAISEYTREELIGHSHNIVRHPDTPNQLFKELWETITAGHIWRGRTKNKTKSGGFYIVETTIVPITDETGEIQEFIAIRQDITHEVMLEEQAKIALAAEKEREASIKIDKAKDSFLMVFTHELKTPLNAIINFSAYLANTLRTSSLPDKEELVQLADLIHTNGEEMLETVTTLLELGKLKAHKIDLHRSDFNLSALLRDAMPYFTRLAEQHNAMIESDIADGIIINSDPLRVRQIVGNLVSNAFKYGHGRVKLSLSADVEGFLLCVEDNGPGIRNQEKIFDLFEQDQDSQLTRSVKGTGVGLHFVKLFCEELGLKIHIDRSPTLGGALFCLSGPRLS